MLDGLALAHTYRVWISSTAADGRHAETSVDVTTPVPSGPVTATVGNGSVLLDGQPWFPFLECGQCSRYAASSLQAGITLFASNPCGGLDAQLSALQGKALSAAVAGEDGADAAGVVGTFYPDEADAHGYTGALLPRVTGGLRLLTLSNHFYSGADPLPGGRGRTVYPSLVAASDLVGFDLYPLQGWCRRDALADVESAQRELVSLAAGRPTFQWIEAAGMSCPADPALAVTPATVRAESWLAIVGGARGLGFFPAAWTGDVGGAIASVADDVAAFLPALFGPRTQTTVSAAGDLVRCAAWEAGGSVYVAAVNAGQDAVHATLAVSGLGDRVLTVLGESRTLTASGGAVEDDFAPLAVHLYVSAPPGS
jgi:hypothetical protein